MTKKMLVKTEFVDMTWVGKCFEGVRWVRRRRAGVKKLM